MDVPTVIATIFPDAGLTGFTGLALTLVIMSLAAMLFETVSVADKQRKSTNVLGRLRSWWSQHQQLLSTSETLAREEEQAAAKTAAAETTSPATPDTEAAPCTSPTYGRLWREMRQIIAWRFALPATLLSLVCTALGFVLPATHGQMWDAAVRGAAAYNRTATAAAEAEAEAGAQPPAFVAAEAEVWQLLRINAALAVLRYLLEVAMGTLFAWARWEMSMSVRKVFFTALTTQEHAWYDRHSDVSELAARLRDEPDRLQDCANHAVERVLQGVLKCAMGVGMILALDWRMGMVCAVLKLAPWGYFSGVAWRYVVHYGRMQQRAMTKVDSAASQALAHVRVVQAHAAEDVERATYVHRVDGYLDVIRNTLLTETVLRFTQFATQLVADNIELVIGAQRVLSGALTLGQYWAFAGYMTNTIDGAKQVGNVKMQLQQLRHEAARYFQTIDRVPAIGNPAGSPNPVSTRARAAKPGVGSRRCRGALRLDAVSFAYPSRPDMQVLHGITLQVPTAKTLALVGPSGSGKSTIIKLLQRFYDPVPAQGAGSGTSAGIGQGRVLLDGTDVRELDLHWLRRQFGYVAQEPTLFSKTIAENIAYGWDAEGGHGLGHARGGCAAMSAATMRAVQAAAKLANAHDFVSALPDGYYSAVGDRGGHLSGGQRQRIVIARAVVRNPAVLLLDEATSSLDAEAELLVRQALRRVSARRTTVVIAHRLSTVRDADMIAVVDSGRLLQQGTHTELLERGGRYKQLVQAQMMDL